MSDRASRQASPQGASMSANRQRLKSTIRRIALSPEERRALLGEGQNKGGKPSSSGVGTSEAASEEVEQCCGGGTSIRDPDADDANQDDGLDSDDPAKLSSGDGTLSGVTDCATGEPICFNGGGFIPPAGWDEPDEPGIDPTYDEGFFYAAYRLGAEVLWCGTASATVSGAEALADERDRTYDEIRKYDCSGTECDGNEAKEAACNPSEEDILIDGGVWPSDGCTNLAIINGSIVGSKYAPENDGSYSAPRSEIDLCDGEGNKIKLAPAADGGWKTLNSTEDNGYLYDSSGKQIAHIDGNEYSDPSV